MSRNASRRGAVDMGVPLMILAFVVIGGFLYWLNVQADAERSLDVVEDTTPEMTGLDNAPTVAVADLQMDASSFEGQMVRLAGLEVASQLGQQGFWLVVPNQQNQSPFLVTMSEEVMAEGTMVSGGQRVTVVGRILAMSDSIISGWVNAGTIGEGDRLAAEFATHFMEAERIEVATGGQAGDSASAN